MDYNSFKRQSVGGLEPVAEFKEIAEAIGYGEVVARLGVAVHGDSGFRDVHHSDFADYCLSQHALLASIWFACPHS